MNYRRDEYWSAREIAALRDLWESGSSARTIATALGGRSHNAVLGKAHRLGLPKRKPRVVREKIGRPAPVVRKPAPVHPPRTVRLFFTDADWRPPGMPCKLCGAARGCSCR